MNYQEMSSNKWKSQKGEYVEIKNEFLMKTRKNGKKIKTKRQERHKRNVV